MTIHHDKLCYGKVEQVDKDMSEEEILAMLSALAEEESEEEGEEEEERAGEETERKE